jgi:hypothetical protein
VVFVFSFDAQRSEICNFADDPDNRFNINGACNGMLVRLCYLGSVQVRLVANPVGKLQEIDNLASFK